MTSMRIQAWVGIQLVGLSALFACSFGHKNWVIFRRSSVANSVSRSSYSRDRAIRTNITRVKCERDWLWIIPPYCVFGIRLNSTQRAMFVRQTRFKSNMTLLYATKKHPAFGLLRPPEVYPSWRGLSMHNQIIPLKWPGFETSCSVFVLARGECTFVQTYSKPLPRQILLSWSSTSSTVAIIVHLLQRVQPSLSTTITFLVRRWFPSQVLIVAWCTPLWPLLSTATATAAIIVHRHRFSRPLLISITGVDCCLECLTLPVLSFLSSCRRHCP